MSDDSKPFNVVVVSGDVRFDLNIDGQRHTFRIDENALADLNESDYGFDRAEVFWKFEYRIVAVARKLIAAGVRETTIPIGPMMFA
jgi:hypothetical protein